MEYWTMLIFTFVGGPFDMTHSGIVYYPSLEDCIAAHQVVSATLPYDHQIECVETTLLSKSIRPMPRPDNLGG